MVVHGGVWRYIVVYDGDMMVYSGILLCAVVIWKWCGGGIVVMSRLYGGDTVVIWWLYCCYMVVTWWYMVLIL